MRNLTVLGFVIVIVFVGKAYYDTNTIEVRHYQIKNVPLSEALAGIKIALLADLHCKKLGMMEDKLL